MSIQLVIDDFGLSNDIQLVVTDDNLLEIRLEINRCLMWPSRLLRIRISKIFFKHFKDLEGMQEVSVCRVTPRSELARKYQWQVPKWLNDKLIIDLNLLTDNKINPASTLKKKPVLFFLTLLHPGLGQPKNCLEFYEALQTVPDAVRKLLYIDNVRQELTNIFGKFFENSGAAQLFFESLVKSNLSIAAMLANIAYDQIMEQLRQFVQSHRLIFALPPRNHDIKLLQIPQIPTLEPEESQLVQPFLDLLNDVEIRICENQLPNTSLADLCFVSWPSVLDHFDKLLSDQPSFGTPELVEALETLNTPNGLKLAEKIRLTLQTCEPLPPGADIETLKQWVPKYLDYARRRFLSGDEPDENISGSFSDWLTMQKARIARSNIHWRRVSESIAEYLCQQDMLVIVCMVDALGTINTDILTEILHNDLKQVDLQIQEDVLIAPLPTLTEVGKLAVLIGKDTNGSLPNIENLLRLAYQPYLEQSTAIKIFRSWKETREPIDQETRLVVYFKNRLDDRLHDCLNLTKHREDIQPIARQLGKSINNWVKTALQHQKKPVFFIVADHGVTQINRVAEVIPFEGIIGDRTVCINKPPSNTSDDFAKYESGNKSYLVPKRRVRLQSGTPLVHGGLTPEEVLIPLITIGFDYLSKKPQYPIEICLLKDSALTVPDGWQIYFKIQSHARLEKIFLKTLTPFSGKAGPFGPLQRNEETLEHLMLIQSNIEQEGRIHLQIRITYYRPDIGANETLNTTLVVNLPPHILHKDEQAALFETMFD